MHSQFPAARGQLTSRPRQHTVARRALVPALLCVSLGSESFLPPSQAADPVRSDSISILDLRGARLGSRLPRDWKVREVRGQRAPDSEVRNDGDGPVLRIRSAGRAAWFYREMSPELPESKGELRWSWRVLEAPEHADLRADDLDDSPIRVFVVFGRQRLFGSSARIVFYTFGNAEPPDFERRSAASDRLHVIRIDGASERMGWRDHAIEPFADYRRIWRETPPPITAIGVMQDTDQTRAQATAELRRLAWIPRSGSAPRLSGQ